MAKSYPTESPPSAYSQLLFQNPKGTANTDLGYHNQHHTRIRNRRHHNHNHHHDQHQHTSHKQPDYLPLRDDFEGLKFTELSVTHDDTAIYRTILGESIIPDDYYESSNYNNHNNNNLELRLIRFVCTLKFPTPTMGYDDEEHEDTRQSLTNMLSTTKPTSFAFEFQRPTKLPSSLLQFVNSCVRSLDLVSALHGLASYSNLFLKRHRIFAKLKHEFGIDEDNQQQLSSPLYWSHDNIHEDEDEEAISNSRIILAPSRILQLSLCISWNITIKPLEQDPNAEAVSKIQVLVLPKDSEKPMVSDTFPDAFNMLLKEHGLYKAVCILHDIIQ